MSDLNQEAKSIARTIRTDLRKAVKTGHLPPGTKVSARKEDASLMVAVRVHVDTADDVETFAFDQNEGRMIKTRRGREITTVIQKAVAPHLPWQDNKMKFVDASLDGLCVPDEPVQDKATVRRTPNGQWAIDPDGRYRVSGPDVHVKSSHTEAIRSLHDPVGAGSLRLIRGGKSS